MRYSLRTAPLGGMSPAEWGRQQAGRNGCRCSTAGEEWDKRIVVCDFQMLLWLSSSFIDYLSRSPNARVDFAGDIPFETADDFALAHSLSGSTSHVRLGPQLVA